MKPYFFLNRCSQGSSASRVSAALLAKLVRSSPLNRGSSGFSDSADDLMIFRLLYHAVCTLRPSMFLGDVMKIVGSMMEQGDISSSRQWT